MNKFSYIVFFIVIVADVISAATFTFSANYKMYITKQLGKDDYLSGTAFFHYDSSVAKNNIIHYRHNLKGVNGKIETISEFENFTVGKIYKVCTSKCEGSALARDPEPWWMKSGDTKSTGTFKDGNGKVYTCYKRKNDRIGGITEVYLQSTPSAVTVPSNTDQIAGKIVFGDGRELILDLSTYTSIQRTNSGFSMPKNVVCETKACKSYLDIAFVLDESGSISSTNFNTMKTFVRSLVGNLTVAADAANIGVVMFSSSARTVFNLEYVNVDSKIQNIRQNYGTTYQGAGLKLAYEMLTSKNTRIARYGKPTQFVIALTDGADFDYNSITTQANRLKNFGVFLVEVGIGISKTYADKLTAVASKLNGVPGYFDVKNFDALLTKINDLVVPICESSNSSSCDLKCNGYCGCDRACYCPDCKETGTACLKRTCEVVGITTAGCKNETTQPFYDKCINFKCDHKDGWDTSETVVCDQNMKTCEDQSCDPTAGCLESRKNHNRCVDLPNKCHVGKCDPSKPNANSTTGCVYENTCTGESDSTKTYNGKRGCIEYSCIDGRCAEIDTCSSNNINNCMPMHCNRKTHQCEIDGDEEVNCTVDSNCEQKDACTTVSCVNGKCAYAPKENSLPDNCNGCYKARCNETTGVYDIYYKGCGNTDMCLDETCDVTTGECTYKPKYPYKSCMEVECNSSTGEGRGYVPRNCSNPEIEGKYCIRYRCDVETDRCVDYTVSAEEGCITENPLCKNITCTEEDKFLCVIKPKVANRTCENPVCDPETGNITWVPKCDDGKVCTIDDCDYDGICTHEKNDCSHLDNEELESCFDIKCSESRKNGCYLKIFDNAYFDECGNCIGGYDETRKESDKERKKCKKALTWEEKTAAISAGVLGGVIAACIIGAIGVSIGGTLLTRELIRRARAAADSGAVENPMYQDNGREMSNPAFEGEDME